MAKDLILSMLNLKKRNDYIQQFITLFCKEPEKIKKNTGFITFMIMKNYYVSIITICLEIQILISSYK